VIDEQVHFSKLVGYGPLESCYHLIIHCDVVAAPKRLRRNGEQLARAMRPSEVIVPSGMIRGGGVIATTALSLTLAAGITGMRVGGIRLGATLQMRVTPTTDRSMVIMV
jgi:hypothetical protein